MLEKENILVELGKILANQLNYQKYQRTIKNSLQS